MFVGYTDLLARLYGEIQIVQYVREVGLMANDEMGTWKKMATTYCISNDKILAHNFSLRWP